MVYPNVLMSLSVFSSVASLIGAMAMTTMTTSTVTTTTLPNGLPMHSGKLPNGLQIYIVENHNAPVFTFQTWFRVGSKDEKTDPKLNATGLAHFFEHMMFRGTKNTPDGEFDRILTRNGVSNENATTWLDRTNYFESMPSKHLELVMQLESDRMANIVIDQKLLDTERGAVLGEYAMGKDDPGNVASELLFETAYTLHPYRYSVIGTEQEIKRFSKEEAEYFYRTYYAPNNATILIVGDVDPVHAMSLITKYYGTCRPQPLGHQRPPVEPAQTAMRSVSFEHAQHEQPKILIAYHVPEATHQDMPTLMILQSMLTSGEGSILSSKWVNAGLSVNVSGELVMLKDPGLFTISAEVRKGHAPDELLTAMDSELLRIADAANDISGEVMRARNQFLLSVYKSWDGNESLAGFMGEYIITAGTPLYAFYFVSTAEKITPDAVKAAAAKYLVQSNRTVVIGKSK